MRKLVAGQPKRRPQSIWIWKPERRIPTIGTSRLPVAEQPKNQSDGEPPPHANFGGCTMAKMMKRSRELPGRSTSVAAVVAVMVGAYGYPAMAADHQIYQNGNFTLNAQFQAVLWGVTTQDAAFGAGRFNSGGDFETDP